MNRKVTLEIMEVDNGYIFETYVDYLKKESQVYEITAGLCVIDEEIYDVSEQLLTNLLRELELII